MQSLLLLCSLVTLETCNKSLPARSRSVSLCCCRLCTGVTKCLAVPAAASCKASSVFAALGEIDPAAHNFKVLLRHVISRVMDAIPSKLLDKELGLPPAAEVEELSSEAEQAQHGGQAHSKDAAEKDSQAQQAKQATALDGDPEEEEEGRERLPLFSHKVMTFVQHLLKYKVRFLASAFTTTLLLWSHSTRSLSRPVMTPRSSIYCSRASQNACL